MTMGDTSAASRLDRLLDEQARRFQQGERVLVEPLLDTQPDLHSHTDLVLDLICHEMHLREQVGEAVELADYLQRFPHLADDLRRQFEVHGVLNPQRFPTVASDRAPQDATVRAQHTVAMDAAGVLGAGPLPPDVASSALGGYELLEEIGRGGMGVVYKARQIKANRLVALKMILAEGQAGAAAVARFRTEAEAIARLQHANIVQIYEVGELNGRPFFSLELCTGGTLDRKLAGTPLVPGDAVLLAEKLARAMQAAHEARVLHRDLKPGNVLLSSDGTPKISDFGLAKNLDEAGQTDTDAVMGTPSYMAPEQAQGKSREVGPTADVYALGAILYECLTGRPPFRAATRMETILQVINDEPVRPRQLQSKVPRDLETICLKCLHKAPSRRYESAAELADDLGRYHRGEPVRARPVRQGERAVKWVKRRPALAGLAALAILVTLGSVLGVWQWQQQRTEARMRSLQTDQAVHGLLERGQRQLEAGWQSQSVGQLKEVSLEARRAVDIAQKGDAGSAVQEQAAAFQADAVDRVARVEKNRALFDALVNVSMLQHEFRPMDDTGRVRALGPMSVDEQYAQAFRDWGLDIEHTPETAASARLRAEPEIVVHQVVAGLDTWILHRRQANSDWPRLLRLAEQLDRNETRQQLRALPLDETPPGVETWLRSSVRRRPGWHFGTWQGGEHGSDCRNWVAGWTWQRNPRLRLYCSHRRTSSGATCLRPNESCVARWRHGRTRWRC
jgi:tRNA A-37 threonylcarbamoyl transferase component Bud32